MKKVTLSFILFFTIFRLNSQINLEHSYTGGLTVYQFSVSGYKYALFPNGTNQVKLYNLDHSLWKTISWSAISGYNSAFLGASEKLFDLDNQIEIIVTYSTTTSPISYHTKIFNEDGSLLMDIPNRGAMTYNSGIHATGTNSYKLIVSDANNTIYDVYSLPGTSSNLGVPNNPMNELSGISFPNPTSKTITIPYQLANGQTSGQLNVYNSIGVLVESFQVDSNFSDLILDVSNYSNGLYRYNIVSNGIESESKSFVKQ